MYRGIELTTIYSMEPFQLEALFSDWEQKLKFKTDLNNPKIPTRFVMTNGTLIYGTAPAAIGKRSATAAKPLPIDPFEADE